MKTASQKQKELGQIFTPEWVVNFMLDKINYKGKHILGKRILEPSFGEGAFLVEIVRRYISASVKCGHDNRHIKMGLENDIYGVELDNDLYNRAINLLNNEAKKQGINSVNWKLYNRNFLKFNLNSLELNFAASKNFIFASSFDIVVGNPPYIKVHNLDSDSRRILKGNYQFCNYGMIDIYLAFYELGIKFIKDGGQLIYITPNMFMKNSSNQAFRNYLTKNSLIESMVDFGSHQVFDSFNTYSCVVHLIKGKRNDNFSYYRRDSDGNIKMENILSNKDYIDKKLILGNKSQLNLLSSKGQKKKISDVANVQYGICTMRDKVFISRAVENLSDKTVNFNGYEIENGLLRDIVKISKSLQNKHKIIFPYEKINDKWRGIGKEKLRTMFPLTWKYLNLKKKELLRRDADKSALWYEFGRSQGIQSIHQPKIAVDILVNGCINAQILDEETLIYSGVFITSTSESLNKIEKALKSRKFYDYARFVGKDLQQGYKSISGNIIKEYYYE